MLVSGTVHFEDIGPGLWGLVSADGRKWEILNFPEQLKWAGARVHARLRLAEDQVSVFMWGTLAWMTGFETIDPDSPRLGDD